MESFVIVFGFPLDTCSSVNSVAQLVWRRQTQTQDKVSSWPVRRGVIREEPSQFAYRSKFSVNPISSIDTHLRLARWRLDNRNGTAPGIIYSAAKAQFNLAWYDRECIPNEYTSSQSFSREEVYRVWRVWEMFLSKATVENDQVHGE